MWNLDLMPKSAKKVEESAKLMHYEPERRQMVSLDNLSWYNESRSRLASFGLRASGEVSWRVEIVDAAVHQERLLASGVSANVSEAMAAISAVMLAPPVLRYRFHQVGSDNYSKLYESMAQARGVAGSYSRVSGVRHVVEAVEV
jgi:hypothetical protein